MKNLKEIESEIATLKKEYKDLQQTKWTEAKGRKENRIKKDIKLLYEIKKYLELTPQKII